MPSFSLGQWGFPIIVLIGFAIYYFAKKRGINWNFKSHSSVTPFLDLYCIDFTTLARNKKLDPVIGRVDEVLKLAQVLSRRSKNNAILVGPPGVGKTAIVEGLAQRIVRNEVPDSLINKRLLALDVATLMSGTKYRGEFEERAKKIVREIENSKRSIILFIDEIHLVVQTQGTEGAINFSDILKPALARGDMQMVGATTNDEYEKYIKTDSSLERRFQPVEVSEPTEVETIQILKGVKDKYREYHKVEFTDAALEVAAKLSQKLIKERKLPDKAIDAVDEAASMVKVSHIHSDVPIVLYQAAVQNNPKVVELWKRIQELDSKNSIKKVLEITQERELFENQLEKMGVVTVDSGDIEKIIRGWVK